MPDSPSPPPLEDSHERELLAQLRAGQAAGYERLVKRYGGRMLTVARHMLHDEEDARDCVQDAFLQAFRRIHQFEGRASIGSWLHRILVNAALMKLRTRERRSEDSIEDLLPRFDSEGFRLEPERKISQPTERTVARAETDEFVRRAIDRLPETYRNVLLLRDIEGYETEETAKLLGVSSGAIKTRLHRARAALKTSIEPVLWEHRG